MKFHFPFIPNLFLCFKPYLGEGEVRMAKLRKKENRQQVEFALHFRSWILILYHCGLICYREKENPLTLYETKETKRNKKE